MKQTIRLSSSIILSLIVLFLAACSGQNDTDNAVHDSGLEIDFDEFNSKYDENPSSCKDCNVIFILIDTLRADHLGFYGYDRDTSPFMDKISRNAVVFQDSRSQAACTFPSMNSILTSRYPQEFILHSNQSKKQGPDDGILRYMNHGIPENMVSLPVILKENGYSTMAVSASPIVRDTPSKVNLFGGFGAGFDIFDEECLKDKHANCVNEKAFLKLENLTQPYFMYLHYMDPHAPYNPPKDFKRRWSTDYVSDFKFVNIGQIAQITKMIFSNGTKYDTTKEDIQHLVNLYDDEILYLDSQLKILYEELEKKDLLEDTIIIITSDHGEEFLEHGAIGHCRTLYDTLIKVPLMISLPSGLSQSIEGDVSGIDIMPTLLDMLNISSDEYQFEGTSLVGLIKGQDNRLKFTHSAQNLLRSWTQESHKLIRDIETGEIVLFDMKTDLGETIDVQEDNIELFSDFNNQLDEILIRVEGSISSNQSILSGKEVLEQLKALGYLG